MIRVIIATVCMLHFLPAAAQDTGLSYSGEIKYERLDFGGYSQNLFFGDVGLSWRSGGLWGIDAALDANRIDGQDLTNVWAALVLSTGAGEIAIGAPRPTVETLGVLPRFGYSRYMEYQVSDLTGPLTRWLSMLDNGLSPGVTYKYASGNLSFGVGYHYNNAGPFTDSWEGMLRYKAGPTRLFLHAEHHEGVFPVTFVQLGAFYEAERFEVGGAISQRVSNALTYNAMRLYGSFDIMPSLTVRGDILVPQGPRENSYSLSMVYGWENGVFVEGGRRVVYGADPMYDLGVGFKF